MIFNSMVSLKGIDTFEIAPSGNTLSNVTGKMQKKMLL